MRCRCSCRCRQQTVMVLGKCCCAQCSSATIRPRPRAVKRQGNDRSDQLHTPLHKLTEICGTRHLRLQPAPRLYCMIGNFHRLGSLATCTDIDCKLHQSMQIWPTDYQWARWHLFGQLVQFQTLLSRYGSDRLWKNTCNHG